MPILIDDSLDLTTIFFKFLFYILLCVEQRRVEYIFMYLCSIPKN